MSRYKPSPVGRHCRRDMDKSISQSSREFGGFTFKLRMLATKQRVQEVRIGQCEWNIFLISCGETNFEPSLSGDDSPA